MSNPRDTRIRDQYFPGADKLVSNRSKKGVAGIPVALRKVLPHLLPSELRIFIYLSLRANQNGMCDLSFEEMLHDLRSTKKSLKRHLEGLVAKRFLSRSSGGGKQYFLIHDPRVPIQCLVDERKISSLELLEINELLYDLGQGPIQAPPAALPTAPTPTLQIAINIPQPTQESPAKPFNKEVEDALAAITRQRMSNPAAAAETVQVGVLTEDPSERDSAAEDLATTLKRNWLGSTKAYVSNARTIFGRPAKNEPEHGTA